MRIVQPSFSVVLPRKKGKAKKERSTTILSGKSMPKEGAQAFEPSRHEPTELHGLLKSRPSLKDFEQQIQKLLVHNPFEVPEQLRNEYGETPLHVAVNNGCGHQITKRLLSGLTGNFPAIIQDDQGHLPLHAVCNSSLLVGTRELVDDDKSEHSLIEDYVKVLHILLNAYPDAVSIQDNNGFTAMNIAVQNAVNRRIIIVLEEATRSRNPVDEDEYFYMASLARAKTICLQKTLGCGIQVDVEVPLEVYCFEDNSRPVSPVTVPPVESSHTRMTPLDSPGFPATITKMQTDNRKCLAAA